MKKLHFLVLVFASVNTFCQTDQNGNPVFNSIAINEEVIKDFKLTSNYYTLKTNIDNKSSSVYISDKPTLYEINNAAINLPSDFFIITKGQNIITMVLFITYPAKKLVVINPTTGKQSGFDCSIKGEITENRANEIIKENYDVAAKIDGNKLFFNNKKLKIISTKDIKRNVLELIEKQKLYVSSDTSQLKLLSRSELRALILTQTKEGGKLDFFTPIKGKEYNGVQIKPGLFTTNIGVALYNWGRANFEFGVNTVEDAFSIFAEFKGRDLNQREKDYIKKGFGKELE